MTPTSHTLSLQGSPDARAAVGLTTGFIFLSDLLYQYLVLQFTQPHLFCFPGIIATPSYIQYLTHALGTKFMQILANELVSPSLFREKMLIVFLEFHALLPLLPAAAAVA